MSLYKDASLVMIPSAVKDGKLYSIRPTDGSGDFTFSRGSNLAATRVDVNGLIEKGRENLLLQSNNFNTTWSKPNSTLTQGFSGYDGSNNAWKWASTAAATTQLSQGTSGVSGMRTLSIYAKAGSRDVFSIWVGTGIDFNLTTGQAAGHANASMESVGNGWWRCSYFNDYGTLNPYYVASAAGEFIYIMNAQAEQGLVATDYIETGASTAQAGILEDLPRLDYSGGASCPSLLLEPQRSNKFLFSEYYGSGALAIYQTGTNTHSVTNNYAVSPEGVQNAIRFVADITSADDRVVLRDGVSCGGGNHTLTFYAKSNTSDTYTMKMHFDGSGKKQIQVTPEWQRFEYGESANSTCNAGIECSSASGYSPSVDISVYGFQLEENLYPTSYIPTYGSAVTRLDDDCRASGIEDYIGKNEGTIFVDVDIKEEVNTESYFMRVDASSFSDTIYIVRNTDKSVSGVLRSNNSTIFNQWLPSQSGRIKAALAYKSGDFAFYINGTEVATSSATYSHSFVYNDITLGEYKGSTAQMSGLMKQALVFKTRLTNAELAALTA